MRQIGCVQVYKSASETSSLIADDTVEEDCILDEALLEPIACGVFLPRQVASSHGLGRHGTCKHIPSIFEK